MKQNLLILIGGFFFASFLYQPSQAQGTSVSPTFNSANIDNNDLSSVNLRAIKDFAKNYKAASDARWHKIRDGFIANYTLDGIKSKSAYDLHGKWVYTIKFYGEDQLPKDVRTLVKSTYFDFSITQVEEVQAIENLVYLVHIQNKGDWKILKVTDGEMDIYKQGTL